MTDGQKVRLGIVGATPERGWAGVAHVPAIRAVPSLALQAVATRHEKSARAAAAAFDAPLWFSDPAAMIADKDVDAIVVAVKAPDHFPLVEQALKLGKPVYCEWPLGRSLTETTVLERLALQGRVITAIGLQSRHSPWVNQVRDLIRDGQIGTVLSTTLTAYDEFSVGSVEQGNRYMLDVRNGANPLTIHAGHYIDALCFVLGEFSSIAAATATSRPVVTVRETGEKVTATSPDQTLVCGMLESGTIASIHVRAGKGSPSVRWEIQGGSATLRITSDGYLMWHPLTIEIWRGESWETLPPLDRSGGWRGIAVEPGPAENVAYAYSAFANDIMTGSAHSITFTHALLRHRTIAAIEAATAKFGATYR